MLRLLTALTALGDCCDPPPRAGCGPAATGAVGGVLARLRTPASGLIELSRPTGATGGPALGPVGWSRQTVLFAEELPAAEARRRQILVALDRAVNRADPRHVPVLRTRPGSRCARRCRSRGAGRTG